MIAIRVPKNWTALEANAAINLIETILDALWRQYPEAHEEYFSSDYDWYDSCEPPPYDDELPGDDEESKIGFEADEIPF